MTVSQNDAEQRLARIERMIAEFRAARQRELLQRAMRLWRLAEASALRIGRPLLPRIH